MNRSSALLEEDVHSIPALVAMKRDRADGIYFKGRVLDLPNWTTADLMARFENTNDPLMLWALHLEHQRGIPPALRWPWHNLGPQGDYIDLSADLLWLQRRHPTQKAAFRGWKNTLNRAPGTAAWHAHVYRQFLHFYPRGLAHLASKGLALTKEQRQQLLSVPTVKMCKARAGLEGAKFAALIARLRTYAEQHPDKSGQCSAEQIATRRARLHRVHVLTGSSPSRTAEYWLAITGESLSRQLVSKQLTLVSSIDQ